jgi:tetratricopeptide (TPR) repeat protein
LYVVSGFTAARREVESVGVLKRILPVAEALVRDNPANSLYCDTLVRVYRAAATACLGLGDLAGALDYEQKVLKLEPAPLSPTDVYDRALRLARTGSLEFLLGHREPGQERWREALAMFQEAARSSQQRWTANKRNLAALETLSLGEDAAGDIWEEFGDLAQAQRLRESAYAHATAFLHADNAAAANRNRVRARA